MADSKYQPVPHHDTLDSPNISTEHSSLTPHHQSRHHPSNPIDASDLSSKEDSDTENDIMDIDEEEGADETVMAPLNRRATSSSSSKKSRQLSRRRSPTDSKFRRWMSLLKKSIVRHRLALVAAAGLIFIFLPLIAYQRSIRSFFWADQVYVCSFYVSTDAIWDADRVGGRNLRHGIRRRGVGRRRRGHIAIEKLRRWCRI